MRELNVAEVGVVSGADGMSPAVGIGLTLSLLGGAALVGAATPVIAATAIGSVMVMGVIAAGQAAQCALQDKKGGSC